jgi:hypothetical protein
MSHTKAAACTCQSDALTTKKKSLADGAGRSQSCLCSDVSADHDQTDSFSTLLLYNFTHMHAAVPTFTIGAQGGVWLGHRILCARSPATPMSKINPDHTLHIQRCCIYFAKKPPHDPHSCSVHFTKKTPDAAPLDVEGVV